MSWQEPAYWVHVFFPYDKDGMVKPGETPPIRICVARSVPSTSYAANKARFGDDMEVVFEDYNNRKLILRRDSYKGRMVEMRPGLHSATGGYSTYSLAHQDAGVDLGGEDLDMYDIETKQHEVLEYVSSGCGPHFLFKEHADGTRTLLTGWHRLHPSVYAHRVGEVGKYDKYLWGYERYLKPIPEELLRELGMISDTK